MILPSVNGKPSEVLLVLESSYWKDSIGQVFKDVLRAETPGLPQDEPLFDLVQVPNKGFTRFMLAARNIIRTNIAEGLKPAIKFEKDVWAEPQMVIRMQAGNKKDFLELTKKYSSQITEHLLEAERRRNLIRATKYEAIAVEKILKKEHNISMIIPKDFTLFDNKENFVWLKKDTRNYMMGIFVYYYNFTDTSTFTLDYLIAKRDSILEKRVPGEYEGSYMTTEHRVYPFFSEITYNKHYFAEIRGRWDMVNDAMGGPFVSYTTVDEKRNRVVTVEGFAFYPNNNKRDLIRRLQAILLTLEFED